MSLTCPHCGSINPQGTRTCSCGEVLSEGDITREAAGPSGAARSASVAQPTLCPVCHGSNVRLDGWANMETRLQFGSRWTGPGNVGYVPNCLGCMDCGHVGFYLGPDDVQRLRAQPITSNAPVRKSSTGCGSKVLMLIALAVMASAALANY